MAKSILKQAAVRDFTGGLNFTDNPYNLSSKYQMVSDNCIVGPDGALSPRMGYKFTTDLRQGTSTLVATPPITSAQVFSNNPEMRLTWNAHGLTNQSTIEFRTPVVIGGLYTLSGAYSVFPVDANIFRIYMRAAAGAAGTFAVSGVTNVVKSTNLAPGSTLEMAFFQGNLIVFDNTGVINAVNVDTGSAVRIWDAERASIVPKPAANAPPPPWRAGAKHISYATFKQTLLAVDGRLNDKPIQINFQRPGGLSPVWYLTDPGAENSNAAIYAADYIQSFNGFVLLYGSYNTVTWTSELPPLTLVDISAKDMSFMFKGATGPGAPGDAVQLDIGITSQTTEPRITGVSTIRSKLFVGFPDSALLGTIGTYIGEIHEPEFKDQVPQHGSLNHRVIQNIGNDLFMCDYAGIPAFSQSQESGTIAPERLSQLIYSELNKHMSRLSADTLRYKVWSLYNVRDRMYMLFMPKFDSASVRTTVGDVLYVVSDFRMEQEVLMRIPNHGTSAGDYITIAGTITCPGLANADIIGMRRVVAVIDPDNILVKVGAIPTVDGAVGTASTAVTITPLDDETICYAYQYNTTMNIRRWTRFRGWYMVAGCTSSDGRVFMCDRDNKIWQLGTVDRPIYADQVGWTTDNVDKPLSGLPIYWAAETPWSDMGDRTLMKIGEHATFDVDGYGKFNFSLFVDNIYNDRMTYMLSPAATMGVSNIPNVFGSGAGAFGAADLIYGQGRRAREQFNYHFPFRAKLARMRFDGAAKEYLRIVAATLSYKKGSIYR